MRGIESQGMLLAADADGVHQVRHHRHRREEGSDSGGNDLGQAHAMSGEDTRPAEDHHLAGWQVAGL